MERVQVQFICLVHDRYLKFHVSQYNFQIGEDIDALFQK